MSRSLKLLILWVLFWLLVVSIFQKVTRLNQAKIVSEWSKSPTPQFIRATIGGKIEEIIVKDNRIDLSEDLNSPLRMGLQGNLNKWVSSGLYFITASDGGDKYLYQNDGVFYVVDSNNNLLYKTKTPFLETVSAIDPSFSPSSNRLIYGVLEVGNPTNKIISIYDEKSDQETNISSQPNAIPYECMVERCDFGWIDDNSLWISKFHLYSLDLNQMNLTKLSSNEMVNWWYLEGLDAIIYQKKDSSDFYMNFLDGSSEDLIIEIPWSLMSTFIYKDISPDRKYLYFLKKTPGINPDGGDFSTDLYVWNMESKKLNKLISGVPEYFEFIWEVD